MTSPRLRKASCFWGLVTWLGFVCASGVNEWELHADAPNLSGRSIKQDAQMKLPDISYRFMQSKRCGTYLHHTSKAYWEVAPRTEASSVATAQPGYRHYYKEHFANGSAWAEPSEPYVWFTPEEDRLAGQLMPGDPSRMRAALHRHLKDGQNLTVAFIGGSFTEGKNPDGLTFPQWFELILRKTDPFRASAAANRLTVINAGMAATTSSYMCLCHSTKLPPNLDIVFVEYAKNDIAGREMESGVRRTYERLLRKLMKYPNRPAVVLLQAFSWNFDADVVTRFYHEHHSVERSLWEFSAYYRLPTLSVKTAAFHLIQAGAEGYQTSEVRMQIIPPVEFTRPREDLKGKVFYLDKGHHTDPHTGSRLVGELAAQLVLDVATGLVRSHLTEHDLARIHREPPVPMILNNYESPLERCFIGPSLVHMVDSSENWNWTDEGRGKWGYIASTPGMTLGMHVNTMLPEGNKPDAKASLRVAYLVSYQHMGMARISCTSGCACDSQVVNMHEAGEQISIMKMHQMDVSQHPECKLTIEVLAETSSGEHKVKIMGVTVSEEPPLLAAQHENVVTWHSQTLERITSRDQNTV